jgi:hypothetical protein
MSNETDIAVLQTKVESLEAAIKAHALRLDSLTAFQRYVISTGTILGVFCGLFAQQIATAIAAMLNGPRG